MQSISREGGNLLCPLEHFLGKPIHSVSQSAGDARPHFREDDGGHDVVPFCFSVSEQHCHLVFKPQKKAERNLRPAFVSDLRYYVSGLFNDNALNSAVAIVVDDVEEVDTCFNIHIEDVRSELLNADQLTSNIIDSHAVDVFAIDGDL